MLLSNLMNNRAKSSRRQQSANFLQSAILRSSDAPRSGMGRYLSNEPPENFSDANATSAKGDRVSSGRPKSHRPKTATSAFNMPRPRKLPPLGDSLENGNDETAGHASKPRSARPKSGKPKSAKRERAATARVRLEETDEAGVDIERCSKCQKNDFFEGRDCMGVALIVFTFVLCFPLGFASLLYWKRTKIRRCANCYQPKPEPAYKPLYLLFIGAGAVAAIIVVLVIGFGTNAGRRVAPFRQG